ncbi:Long chain acyl-CoA synthetase 7 peroxisomal [Thoreauomyces humboldtii]|nr:Long chain acyl-CoA synthetase 7 peroxisomal [Thoreauomyces humboldtii]
MPRPAADNGPSVDVKYYDVETLKKISPQSVELPGTRKDDSETGIFRSALSPEALVFDYPNVKTVYDLFEAGLRKSPKSNCLGHREVIGRDKTGALQWGGYVWQDYQTVARRRLNFGAGLQYIFEDVLGGQVDQKYNLGLYSVNRPEWLIADWAGDAYANASVALYDTLGAETTEFILNHADVPIVVTTPDKVPILLKMAAAIPTVKAIVVMPDVTADAVSGPASVAVFKEWGLEKGVAVYAFGEVEELGLTYPRPVRLPTADDIWCICYTSGTTGMPKGAILTHRNAVAVQRATQSLLEFTPDSVQCSYLPLAHVFEKASCNSVIANGGAMGFFRGDVSMLMDDFTVLKPTLFPSVPRLLNRIYDKINQGAAGGGKVKAALFRTAVSAKLENLKHGQNTHALWDRLVFAKVKAVLGGRMQFLLSGSAPLGADVLLFLRAAMGFQISEGYGATETAAGASITWPGDFSVGHVGPVIQCTEMKLVSVPDMNYHAKDNRGEVWLRGPNIFQGYHKDEEKTKEALTDDGWLKTGDIGQIDSKGRLGIIDRKKNIFKLAQGEYCAPEKLENTFIRSNFIAQMYVHGDSLQSELVGVVVPDPEYSIQWAKEHGLLPASTPAGTPLAPNVPANPAMVELCANPKFLRAIVKDLNRLGKEDKLRGFEFVKAVHLETDVWSVDNNMMTPTFKLKRNEAADRYRTQLDALYADLAAAKAGEAAPEIKAKL